MDAIAARPHSISNFHFGPLPGSSSAAVISRRYARPFLEGMPETRRVAETERSCDVIGAQQGRFQIVFRQRVPNACQKIVVRCALCFEFAPEGAGRHAQRRGDYLDIGEAARCAW